ncbi:MAG: hypothetical protein A2W93_06690 [Bacteroidetes bacterium GWF2_43_63]|nr:MAG: hypothetical protein A2W94_07845 [Bacteroidetes bacterium GWE2_42_42]OFY53306.1 MAG: hypothetical protein A2W93_06690 [Bacteroidetes bacterium GWF2_43_63]HBG71699.1 hypothetical protein [Bacteroidales bacterium]HCB61636.1 hypothetical protein [Bacteroidales bacterium]HCY22848.1 hypothetical protein [Bacteroidales bacterium]
MIGKYKGHYQYDNQKIQKQLKHDLTLFNLEITEFENGHFNGFVEDDIDTGGTPGKGIINGEKNGNEITFIKEMPIASFLINGKMKTYNKKHPKIYYKGTITDDKIEGFWKIKFGVFMNGLMMLIGVKTTGTWQMGKSKAANR